MFIRQVLSPRYSRTHTHTLTPEGKQKIKLANSLYKKKNLTILVPSILRKNKTNNGTKRKAKGIHITSQ